MLIQKIRKLLKLIAGKHKVVLLLKTGSYKPHTAISKPPKRQRKLTSTVWEHYEFLPPDEEGNLFCKCKKCGQIYPGDSKYGTGNLKRHLGNCKRRNFRDICSFF